MLRKFAFVAILGLVSAAQSIAATVTFTLDLSGAVGTFKVLASSSAGDNAGLAGYSLDINGQLTMNHNALRNSAASNANGDEGSVGFTVARTADNNAAGLLGGGQDTITPTPFIVYGMGQTAGSLAALGITPAGIVEGNPWSANLELAVGTYTAGGTLPSFAPVSPEFAANVFTQAGSTATQAATLAFVTLPPVTVDNPILTANPVTGSTLAFGQVNNGSNPAPIPVALSNTGTGSINVTAATFAGPNASLFSLSSPFVASALAGGALPTNYGVDFNVGGGNLPLGNYAATLTFATSSGNVVYNVTAAVPEPATLAMAGLAVVGLVGFSRRK